MVFKSSFFFWTFQYFSLVCVRIWTVVVFFFFNLCNSSFLSSIFSFHVYFLIKIIQKLIKIPDSLFLIARNQSNVDLPLILLSFSESSGSLSDYIEVEEYLVLAVEAELIQGNISVFIKFSILQFMNHLFRHWLIYSRKTDFLETSLFNSIKAILI